MLGVSSESGPNNGMLQLICIQTYHAHWASHSGYHQFLNHLPEEIRVRHLRVPRGTVSGDELKGVFENVGFRIQKRLTKGKMNPWTTDKDLLTEFRLLQEVQVGLKGKGKVIVHFLDGEIGFNFFGILRKFLGRSNERVRLVASYHQPGAMLESVLPHKERTRDLDLVLTVGTSQLPFFDFLPKEKIRFVPHGIDTQYFRPAGRPSSEGPVYCLTVGFWLRDFDALEKVARAAPERIVFRIVADKSNTERFRDMPNVEVYSGIEDSELLRLYQQSNIGLMPLLDSTANNSLLEMMSCGLPIITTRVGSVKDYMPEGTGVLLERNDPQEILHAIHSLNPEARLALGEASRRRALELDWSNVGLQMAEQYRGLYQRAPRICEK